MNYTHDPEEPQIYRTVSKAPSAVELEAIIGCVAGVIGILVTLIGLHRAYYALSYHCKGKVKNVNVTVMPTKDGLKQVFVSWQDPIRSSFQQLMCITKNYIISCNCCTQCNVNTTLHFLEREKAMVEVQEFMEHKLQVKVCYTGRIIEADHWSEISDVTEPGCVVVAPPNKPRITNVLLNKRRLPAILFEKPSRENGNIVEYVLRCRRGNNLEGKEYQVNSSIGNNGYLQTVLHVPLQLGETYNFSIAALSFRGKQEYHGEWSEEFEYIVPDECLSDSTQSWTPQEWKVIQKTIVTRIGTEIDSLGSMIGFSEAELNSLTVKNNNNMKYLEGLATDVLKQWKKQHRTKASMSILYTNLQEIRMISLADLFKKECAAEGLHF